MNTISPDYSYSLPSPHFETSQIIARRSLEADANSSLLVGHQLSLFIESECPTKVCILLVIFLISHSPIYPSSPPERKSTSESGQKSKVYTSPTWPVFWHSGFFFLSRMSHLHQQYWYIAMSLSWPQLAKISGFSLFQFTSSTPVL